MVTCDNNRENVITGLWPHQEWTVHHNLLITDGAIPCSHCPSITQGGLAGLAAHRKLLHRDGGTVRSPADLMLVDSAVDHPERCRHDNVFELERVKVPGENLIRVIYECPGCGLQWAEWENI